MVFIRKKLYQVLIFIRFITRHFCPKCGSRLFGENSAATNIIGVTAGTLNDSHWFKANAIVYNKRKPKWDIMDESIPTFEEMPPL